MQRPLRRGYLRVALFALCALGPAASLWGAPPLVRNIDVRGLQIGAATTLTVDGLDLSGNPRLLCTAALASQAVRPGATANRIEFDVTVDPQATPGLYNLFVVTDGGISERQIVAIDRLPQLPFRDQIETLPVALHGTLSNSSVLQTTFLGQAGQTILCEVEAQRLGGKLRPVLHLYNEQKKQLAWSLPQEGLRGDCRLSATLPAAGKYTLTLHDLQYAAPAPNHFRLKIGQWHYVDQVFPAAVARAAAAQQQVLLIGNATPTPVVLTVPADRQIAIAPWSDPTNASGAPLGVLVSEHPEYLEPADGSQLEAAAFPCAINGRLLQSGEEDLYRIKAPPESKLRLELFAARLGSPIDGLIEIRRADGGVLAQNDDQPGSNDPALDFTLPKELDTVLVAVRDVHRRGGPAQVYRLLVTQPTATETTGDFQLWVDQLAYNVPQNGRQTLRVRAERRGYQGAIALEFAGLPPGITVEGSEIPAGSDAKLVTLIGADAANASGLVTVRGQGLADPARPIVRVARRDPEELTRLQPWLSESFAIGAGARGGAAAYDAVSTPAEQRVVLGKKLPIQVKCKRPAGFDGPVRVTMLTSQAPAQVPGQPVGTIDPNRTFRHESNQPTVELPPDGNAQATWNNKLAADKVLTDAQTALAAAQKAVADAQTAGGAVLEAATKAKTEAEAKVQDATAKAAAALAAAETAAAAAPQDLSFVAFVPAELAGTALEIAFRTELLSRDRQQVLLSHASPVLNLPIVNPIRVVYLGEPKLSAKLDRQQGALFKLAGKIERLEGTSGDVAVTLQGLPPGVPVPRVAVNAQQTDFALELRFPANIPPGLLTDVKLLATGKVDPAHPLETGSNLIDLPIELLPADPQ